VTKLALVKSTLTTAMKAATAATFLLILGLRPGIAAADLARTADFHIAPQPLPAALLQYSEQAAVQVTSPSAILEGKTTAGVLGSYPARNALERLLAGTDLSYDVISSNTVAIRLTSTSSGDARTHLESSLLGGPGANAGVLRLAQADPSMSRETDLVKHFEIKAKPLADALMEFGVQSGLTVVAPTTLTAGKKGAAVRGDLTPTDALGRLLKGSGLTFARAADGTIAIQAISSSNPVQVSTGESRLEKDFTGNEELAEIVVTANRRLQRAQDVPATLQVFSGRDLEKNGADGFADYLGSVPGVSFRDQGNGANKITIRGISNFAASDGAAGPVSTTGFYVNDVTVQGTSVAPDLSLYDVQRIEILKGPQGTLYGDGAMGGAIKMILNAPDASAFEGKGDVSVSSTENGGFNWRARGAVNFPLAQDRVALRIASTYLNDDGYVDNIARADKNANSKESYSIRGVLAANITDAFSAEVLALHNVQNLDDFPQIDKSLGRYRSSVPEDRSDKTKATLIALTLKNKFDFAELSSVTSRYRLDRANIDAVVFGGPTFSAYGPVTQNPFFASPEVRVTTQEFRLVSSGDKRLDWVAGAFYRDRRQMVPSGGFFVPGDLAGINAGLAAAAQPQIPSDGVYFRALTDVSATQYAVYGEGNLQITDRIEFTAGFRWYDEKTTAVTGTTGYSVFTSLTSAPVRIPISDNGVIPKFALSYKVSDGSRIYAQVAKGFRSATPNLNFFLGGDQGAQSDNLWSYEVGSKNSFLNDRAVFNASAFYLDWKGLQALALLPTTTGLISTFIDNAGDGEIYGFEAEASGSLSSAFTLGAAVGYTHSELARTLGTGKVGAVLPQSPQWTASANGEYRVPLTYGDAFARFDVQYVSQQLTTLVQVNTAGVITNDGRPIKASTMGNLKLGLDRKGAWDFTLFVDNLWNERAEVGRGRGTLGGLSDITRFSVARPRTVGLMAAKMF
jgi:iron complex outermembrane receptor protein